MKAGTMLQNTCINIFHQFLLQSLSCIGVWNIVLETSECVTVSVWGGGAATPLFWGKVIKILYKEGYGRDKNNDNLIVK